MPDVSPQLVDSLIRAGELAMMRAGIKHDPTRVARMAHERARFYAGKSPELFGEELLALALKPKTHGPAHSRLKRSKPKPKAPPAPVEDEDPRRPSKSSLRMERAIRSYQRSGLLRRTADQYDIDRMYLKSVLVGLGCYRAHGAYPVSGGLPSLGKRYS